MRGFFITIGVLCVLCWYARSQFNFHDLLVYAKKHPESQFASRIDYDVGLVYYQRGDFPAAQEAFSQLLTDYPTGQFTENGLLRLSEVAVENRDWQVAKDILDRYLQEYPDSANRPLAVKRRELLYNK